MSFSHLFSVFLAWVCVSLSLYFSNKFSHIFYVILSVSHLFLNRKMVKLFPSFSMFYRFFSFLCNFFIRICTLWNRTISNGDSLLEYKDCLISVSLQHRHQCNVSVFIDPILFDPYRFSAPSSEMNAIGLKVPDFYMDRIPFTRTHFFMQIQTGALPKMFFCVKSLIKSCLLWKNGNDEKKIVVFRWKTNPFSFWFEIFFLCHNGRIKTRSWPAF